MKKRLILKKAVFPVSILAAIFPLVASAQGLTLAPQPSVVSADYRMISLIALRVILVLVVVIFGMIAIKSGHYWIHWEGNAKRAYENKRKLALSLLIITICFFILVLYKVFVPDYGVLTL